eukprot:3725473-Rhodomonas_salina.2
MGLGLGAAAALLLQSACLNVRCTTVSEPKQIVTSQSPWKGTVRSRDTGALVTEWSRHRLAA